MDHPIAGTSWTIDLHRNQEGLAQPPREFGDLAVRRGEWWVFTSRRAGRHMDVQGVMEVQLDVRVVVASLPFQLTLTFSSLQVFRVRT